LSSLQDERSEKKKAARNFLRGDIPRPVRRAKEEIGFVKDGGEGSNISLSFLGGHQKEGAKKSLVSVKGRSNRK